MCMLCCRLCGRWRISGMRRRLWRRRGVVEGVLLDAIAEASAVPRDLVRRAHMLHGDIGDVARLAMSKGSTALEKISLRLFVPVKPMLAEMADDAQDVLAEHKDGTAFEYKFDG